MIVDDDHDDGSTNGEVGIIGHGIDLGPQGAIEDDLSKLIPYR